MPRLFLLRHGQTVDNVEKRFGGCSPSPLDAVGREQVLATARRLRDVPFTRIATSPVPRAVESARLVLETQADPRAELEIDPDLTDVDVGAWASCTWEEISTRDPEVYRSWYLDPVSFRFPGGESMRDLFERSWRAFEPYARAAAEERPSQGRRGDASAILVVTHQAVVKAIVLRALGAGLENYWKLRVGNASLAVFEHARGELQLTGFNHNLFDGRG